MGGTLAGGASRPVTEDELVEYGAMQELQARQRVSQGAHPLTAEGAV